jgi:hypothetical protein
MRFPIHLWQGPIGRLFFPALRLWAGPNPEMAYAIAVLVR